MLRNKDPSPKVPQPIDSATIANADVNHLHLCLLVETAFQAASPFIAGLISEGRFFAALSYTP